MGKIKRRKCKLRNHKNLEEGAMKRKNHIQFKTNNKWRLF
jgi:hypothetical protein